VRSESSCFSIGATVRARRFLRKKVAAAAVNARLPPATAIPIPIFTTLVKPLEEFVSGVLVAEGAIVSFPATEVAIEEVDKVEVAGEVEGDVVREIPTVAAIENPFF